MRNPNPSTTLKAGLGVALFLLPLGCSSNQGGERFAGSTSRAKRTVTVMDSGGERVTVDADASETAFKVPVDARTSINQKEAWAVTYSDVFRIVIDDENGEPTYPTTRWKIPLDAGARTFVSEIGLIIGRSRLGDGKTYPHEHRGLYRASDDVPGTVELIYQPADQKVESRLCVTSFRVDGQAYIGGAYTNENDRRIFFRIPIDKTKPKRVDLARKQQWDVGPGWWGYSCYTDQARNYFWAGHWGEITGVNLKDGTPLSKALIPNQAHTNNIAEFKVSPTAHGSYSFSGDEKGNILSAKNPDPNQADYWVSYTWAFDPVSRRLLGSTWNGDKFYLTDPSCFSTDTKCGSTSKHLVFSGMKNFGTIGPMSTLSDGRVAAFSRSSHHTNKDGLSYFYLISVKDPNDPSKGIVLQKIKEIPGETYMYTDFTGATLYPADIEKTVDLNQSKTFRPSIPVTKLEMKWEALSQTADAWRGLSLSLRCYAKSASQKPDYFAIASVPAAGTPIALPASCTGKIDTIDIRIVGDGKSAGFSRTKSIEFSGTQQAEKTATKGG